MINKTFIWIASIAAIMLLSTCTLNWPEYRVIRGEMVLEANCHGPGRGGRFPSHVYSSNGRPTPAAGQGPAKGEKRRGKSAGLAPTSFD
jgi:hypothetical protein